MEITNELLAIYAEGNATPDEKKIVRQYLMENPRQLETVLMVMDDHLDLTLDDEEYEESGRMLQGQYSFQDIAMSAAAFAPQSEMKCSGATSKGTTHRRCFDTCFNELLSEVF